MHFKIAAVPELRWVINPVYLLYSDVLSLRLELLQRNLVPENLQHSAEAMDNKAKTFDSFTFPGEQRRH